MRKPSGDTLIEVMFAFAILATISSVAFSGALSSYKASLSAQWRTEATFVAQYEADALLTYRKSLTWDNFLASTDLVKGSFCMTPSTSSDGSTYWNITTDETSCNNSTKDLLKNVNSPSIKLSLDKKSSTNDQNIVDRALATVVVSWVSKEGQSEQVKNVILLTKEQQ